ncbi:MAG: alpha/beta fold hydrolase [Gammaproteobacteria bacterium]|nr:alpha/beta fold hydrolase [Gammaproteobacteria bacterium]
MSRRLRIASWLLAALVAVATVVYLAGPAYRIDARIAIPPVPQAGPGSDALERGLQDSEARFTDIVPGAEKAIVWAHPDRRRTRLSVIYLHGYTATRQEVAPLCDQLAAALGANLYYTRLTGHGRSPAALGAAEADDWLRDAAEALAIGQALGERVIVVGTSTGGTLALWLAQQPRASAIAAQLLISPNLGPRDERATLLAGPWGRQLQRLLIGEEYRWQPANERQAVFWTWRYPARALVPMMALVKEVRDSPLESVRVPTLVLHSPDDAVVSPARIEAAYARLGSSAKRIVTVMDSGDRSHHVLAGDILSPQSTRAVLGTMLEFLGGLGLRPAPAAGQPPGASGSSASR